MGEGKRPRRNVAAQERMVVVLWDFAAALGAPIPHAPDGAIDEQRLAAVGPALDAAMAAFGYTVTEIQ